MKMLRPLYTTATGIVASVMLLAFIVLAIVAPMVWGDAAVARDILDRNAPTSAEHWFGTTRLGQDIFLRTLVATRLSLVAALIAAAIGICIGLPVGLFASALGPRAKGFFTGVINVMIAFPAVLLALFVAVIVGAGTKAAVIGIGIAMAPGFARLAQTMTASVAKLDYVAAARTMGIGTPRILTRHILPNVAEPLVIQAATSVGVCILGVATMSFLGVGTASPAYDWGSLMITAQKEGNFYPAPLSVIGPATMTALAGIAFVMLGESIAGTIQDTQATGKVNRLARQLRATMKGIPQGAAAAELAAAGASPAASSLAPVLEVDNLKVAFPTADGVVWPVRGISLTLAAGERIGVVGESGSGKTLSMLAIAQLIDYPGQVSADRLDFSGTDIRRLSPAALSRFLGTNLAMVFQNPMSSLNPAMRIGVQVAESSRVHRGLSASEGRQLAIEKLGEVGIPEPELRLRQYPFEFSGGMQQRAMIAMGLTEAPKLIIADEPTTALDVTVQRQILDLLERINAEEGTAIVLISHDIAVVTSVCARVIVMYGGLIMEDLPTDGLLTEAAHPYTLALVEAVPDTHTDKTSPLATIPGRPPALAAMPPGCPFAPRCAFATPECEATQPPLAPSGIGHRVACHHPQTRATVAAAAVARAGSREEVDGDG
ncbi:MAG: dipeptide/oligopeptide/nickel ABC transporter permease/ATP-binding protein [Bifidobacteriaceae bacterium]|jgi:oligopeptide/dipeptide ABC transporter ATP-binding protein|nr:dipeptide/oligopeptide/nickel ABC transporter permease/ATP-binding protein [Bifidobacteriaceae bacterium]